MIENLNTAESGQVHRAVALCRDILGPTLVGVYLHGSAVSQKLRPQSDIDLLIVSSRPLDDPDCARFLAGLLDLSGRYPRLPTDPRCLDVLAVTTAELAAPGYPAACQFIYGEWLREGFESGVPLAPFANPVVTLLLAQARDEAVAIYGPSFAKLAGEISSADIRLALADTLASLIEGLVGDERNVLLTLARMWRTAVVGDFVSKDVAAEWAGPRLAEPARTVLHSAARAYRGEVVDDWSARREDAQVTADMLRDLVLQSLR